MIFTRLEHFWITYFSKLFQNFGLEAPYFLIRLSFSLLHKQKQVKRGIFTRPFVAMFQTLQFQIKKKNFYRVLNCSSIVVNIILNFNQTNFFTSFCQQLSAQDTYKYDSYTKHVIIEQIQVPPSFSPGRYTCFPFRKYAYVDFSPKK